MLAPIYLAVEAILNADQSLSPADRHTILMVCQHPDRFVSNAGEPLPQMLTSNEVAAMLKVSRTTLWRMVRNGALPQVVVSGSPRFRLTDVKGLMDHAYCGKGWNNE